MGFEFNSFDHFRNLIYKHLRAHRGEGRDVPQNIADDEQLKKVFKHNANKFSWDIKQDPRFVDAYNIDIWLRDSPLKVKSQPDLPDGSQPDLPATNVDIFIKSLEDNNFVPPPLTVEFRQYVHSDLTGKTGCIEFMFSEDNTILIEHAEDLSTNVFSTYNNRLAKYQQPIFMRAYFTGNVADALILKAYLVASHGSLLNHEYINTNGKPSLTFTNMPEATDMLQINKIEGEN